MYPQLSKGSYTLFYGDPAVTSLLPEQKNNNISSLLFISFLFNMSLRETLKNLKPLKFIQICSG